MSIPKLKFFALFFVFFAVFWQITTSFYIKMLSAGRQNFSRAAKGAAGLPRKESLRLFQPQAEGNAFRGTLCRAAPHAKKAQRLAAGRCANLRRKIARRSYFALPRCARVKKTEGRLGATVCPAPACLGKMATTLAARFLRGRCSEGTLFAITANVRAPFAPTALRNLNNAPAFAVLFADDLRTIQTIRLLRRLRVLSVRRGNVIMIRARVFIYIFLCYFVKYLPFQTDSRFKKLQRAQKKTPDKTSGAYPVYCFCTGEPQ